MNSVTALDDEEHHFVGSEEDTPGREDKPPPGLRTGEEVKLKKRKSAVSNNFRLRWRTVMINFWRL